MKIGDLVRINIPDWLMRDHGPIDQTVSVILTTDNSDETSTLLLHTGEVWYKISHWWLNVINESR